tara:strand:+ start:932 stop:1330 length:399 start_codon:yes stop_codon:yes gene_type:complete
MKRYRFRGIFLLFLMGHATACASSSWQSSSLTASPDRGVSVADYADYIEEMQPDQVRITTEDRTEYVLHSPSVVGDEIVSADGLSVPIAEIVKLEVQAFDVAGSTLKTTGLTLVAIPVAVALVVTLLFALPR